MAARALCLALLVLAAPARLHGQAGGPRSDPTPPAPTLPPPATVAAIALAIRSRAIQDSRCYLMNGGAVESFFISEDTPVGSIIGTLSVNGDPDEERGDITLRLQERGAAVAIAPGSKNVTLLRALDREEKAGPSNVYVNSFVIPVSVRVWDVNDNAPAWAGGPYRARVSELAAPGARVAPALRATDADQPGPHATVHYAVLPGPYSEYLTFANELDSALTIKKPLDYETIRNFTVVLRAQDQGSPALHSDTTLEVTVLDADDQNPRFSHDHYSAVLPTDAKEGTTLLTSPGPISAADQDLGINAPLHYSATGDHKQLVAVDRDSGQVSVTKELLEMLQPVTIVLKATQVDNSDRYALATLGISRAASPSSPASPAPPAPPAPRPVRFVGRAYSAAVSEAAPPGTALLALETDPPALPHAKNPLQFYVSDRGFLEKFAINSAGEVILRRPLDYETTSAYYYQVMVTDSVTNDTATINITVQNENEWEPRFRFAQYEFRAEAGGERAGGAGGGGGGVRLGRLEAHDGDAGDSVRVMLHGAAAGMFYVDAAGDMFLRQEALPSLNTSVLHVVATAYDSGSPPKQTSVPVIVHVGEELRGAGDAGGAAGPGGGVSAAAAGGAGALLLLVLVAAALCFYMKRAKPSSVSHTKTPVFAHEKPRSPANPSMTSPVRSSPLRAAAPPAPPAPSTTTAPPPPAAAPGAGSSGSLLSVSAGASTILANSSSSLDLQDAPTTDGGAGGGCAALMSDHLQAAARGAGRSGVAWPSRTIPARLKTLSWDDQGSGSENPVHEATNPAVAEHMNLTVYF